MSARILFPGSNIALKTPAYLVEQTERFYRDVVGLRPAGSRRSYQFGEMTIWLDEVPGLSQPEAWLELQTADLDRARAHLADHGIAAEPVEDLPPGYQGFWCRSPSGLVHLVSLEGE